MASEVKNSIASECPRNDLKTLSDGFGIPFVTVFQDFEAFFNKFLGMPLGVLGSDNPLERSGPHVGQELQPLAACYSLRRCISRPVVGECAGLDPGWCRVAAELGLCPGRTA